jgi:predicted outer membrane repeat protein
MNFSGIARSKQLRFEQLEDRHVLAAVTVSNMTDDVNGNTADIPSLITSPGFDGISLREAILAANNTALHDTINFSAILDDANPNIAPKITLTEGELIITDSLTIVAHSVDLPLGITIDASGNDPTPNSTLNDGNSSNDADGSRIFDITSGAVELIGLTLTGGDAPSGGGFLPGGGAIRSLGVLTIRDCHIRDNIAVNSGGAIYHGTISSLYTLPNTQTTLTIIDSLIENNHATGMGGALIVMAGVGGSTPSNFNDTVTISGTVFSGNSATSHGGAIAFNSLSTLTAATLTIDSNSIISGNTSTGGKGGGIYANFNTDDAPTFTDKGVFISDSTISNNRAQGTASGQGDGGGVFAAMGGTEPDSHNVAKELQFLMTRSIVDNNEASNRGGGMFVTGSGGSEITVRDSRVSGNKAGLVFSNPYPDTETHHFSGGGIYASTVSGPEDILQGSNNNTALVAHITISGTTINNNQAGVDGGGVLIFTKRGGALPGTFGMYNSTVSGNTAGRPNNPVPTQGRGGGIHLATFDEVVNADEGIDARLHNVTVTLNTAGTGGGIYVMRPDTSTHALTAMDVRLKNTLVSENEEHDDDADNYWGCINAGETEFSLFGPTNTFAHHNNPHLFLTTQEVDDLFDQLATGNILNSTNDPLLGELANNGGGFVLPDQSHVLTHRPLVGSPVIDRGSDDLAEVPFSGVTLVYDQRGQGFGRFVDVAGVTNGPNNFFVDIGAVEFDTALPPKVINVTISSWSATNPHTPHAFNNAADDVNDFDGSGIQLKTVPVGNADMIAIQFSEHVNVVETSLKLYGLVFASRPALATTNAFSYINNTATWRFATPFAADQYLIWLSDTVTNGAGTPLDGDWVNPASRSTSNSLVSEFPSGNDIAGADFKFVFVALPGDADLTNSVGGRDFLIWQRNTSGSGHTFQQADFNGDGLTNGTDLGFYQLNFGLNLLNLRVAADFDGDFDIDGSDLSIWQSNYGSGMTHAQGDADWDGDVDGRDFLIWQRQFGIQINVAM